MVFDRPFAFQTGQVLRVEAVHCFLGIFINWLDHFSGNTADDRIGWHVFRYDRSRADYDVLSDHDPREHDGVVSYENVIFNDYSPERIERLLVQQVTKDPHAPIVGNELNVTANMDVIADVNEIGFRTEAPTVNATPFPYSANLKNLTQIS
jgi:hypothetical protein